MKKLFSALLAVLMLMACLVGCSDPMANQSATTEPKETTVEETTEATEAKTYDDTLVGLVDYFIDKGYITIAEDKSNITEMDAKLIDASVGYRYKTGYNNTEVLIELYYYENTDNEFVKSVKENGTFQIGELEPVTAYVAQDGKYLMVYTDRSNPADDSDNGKRKAEVIDAFQAFPTIK